VFGCELIEKIRDLKKEQWLNLVFLMSLGGLWSSRGISELSGEPIKGMFDVIAWIFVGLTVVLLILLYWMDLKNGKTKESINNNVKDNEIE